MHVAHGPSVHLAIKGLLALTDELALQPPV